MKTEIEARLLECDVEGLTQKLESLGAKKNGDWLQIRNCYDFTPVRKNSWIRLRKNGKETTLTIKEIGSAKIDGTREAEIVVSDFDITNEILNKLGYQVRTTQENRRIQYILDGVEIDFDFWPMIPTYMEVEAESEEQIKDLCKKLDLNYSEFTTLDVQSVYKHYGIDLNAIQILKLEEDRKGKSDNLIV
ncbi:MAG: CYTH domain-containing protein [Clostridia bacterium]|nr:CYTH domain-containing protein [Clostridia bacterium]